MTRPPRHRPIRAVPAVLAALLLLAAACASDPGGPTATPAPDADAAAGPGGGFPVTIDHAFGSTTLDETPERIVVVGFKEQDYFLALGAVPVGIRDWYGDMPSATWPWAQERLEGEEPEVLPRAELAYEQIVALDPDVIVGMSAGLTEEEYDLLSQIAPTIAQPDGDGSYEVSWQEMTRTAGEIVGEPAQAEAMVEDLEQRIAAVASDHPELDGASMVFASSYDGQNYLFGEKTTAVKLLTELGLVMVPEVAELTDNADQQVVLSPERFDLLEADVTVWSEGLSEAGPEALLADPLYGATTVHAEGRDVFLGTEANGALVFASVLSIPYVLDDVVPALAVAVDGDPATTSPYSPG